MKKIPKSMYISHEQAEPRLQHQTIGAISYFNSRPLLEGLQMLPEINLVRNVPSRMSELLSSRQVEAAILPTIDFQRIEGDVVALPAGCISSAGTTLTVRIFSQVKPWRIKTLWVDSDSHTSVALAQILWHYLYKTRLSVIPFTRGKWDVAEDAQAVLMIGDKVVCDPPLGYDYQYDLGRLWFEMTGLPFVYAIWAAHPSADLPQLYDVLSKIRQDNSDNLEAIAAIQGPMYGWPEDMAKTYLTKYLQYEFGDAQREGVQEFFFLAHEIGLLPQIRDVNFFEP